MLGRRRRGPTALGFAAAVAATAVGGARIRRLTCCERARARRRLASALDDRGHPLEALRRRWCHEAVAREPAALRRQQTHEEAAAVVFLVLRERCEQVLPGRPPLLRVNDAAAATRRSAHLGLRLRLPVRNARVAKRDVALVQPQRVVASLQHDSLDRRRCHCDLWHGPRCQGPRTPPPPVWLEENLYSNAVASAAFALSD